MIVKITQEYITLQNLLKYANVTMSGGESKILIQEGQVRVNGEVCTMRGKKIREGDRIEAMGEEISVQKA